MLPATRLIESLFFEPVSDPPMSRKLAKTGDLGGPGRQKDFPNNSGLAKEAKETNL